MKPLPFLVLSALITLCLAGCDPTGENAVTPQTNQPPAENPFPEDSALDVQITDGASQLIATALTGSLTRDDLGFIHQIAVRDGSLRASSVPLKQGTAYFLSAKGVSAAKYRYKGLVDKSHVFARMKLSTVM